MDGGMGGSIGAEASGRRHRGGGMEAARSAPAVMRPWVMVQFSNPQPVQTGVFLLPSILKGAAIMKPIRLIAAGACVAGVCAIALPIMAQQAASGPVARYDMRAGTVSGMAGMGAGGMMGAMMGGGRGGNRAQHELYLRIGSSRTPDRGSPKADHFMPPSAKLGKSVALVTPREEREPD